MPLGDAIDTTRDNAHRSTRGRVLLVEDDRETADVLRELLVRAGFSCSTETSARAAVSRLSERFDAVVADLHLGGNDGGWLLDRCREISPRTLRILVSADPAGAGVSAAEVFVQKPARALDRILATLLERRRKGHRSSD